MKFRIERNIDRYLLQPGMHAGDLAKKQLAQTDRTSRWSPLSSGQAHVVAVDLRHRAPQRRGGGLHTGSGPETLAQFMVWMLIQLAYWLKSSVGERIPDMTSRGRNCLEACLLRARPREFRGLLPAEPLESSPRAGGFSGTLRVVARHFARIGTG